MGSRGIAFAVVLVLCVLIGGGWVVIASRQSGSGVSAAHVGRPGGERLDLRALVLVRAVGDRDDRLNGRATLARLGSGGGGIRESRLGCQRIYQAAGRGLCLSLAPSGVDYRLQIFDTRFRTVHEEPLTGLPSRARVSPTGRYGAVTTFVLGHSYATPGTFSTRTTILDMRSGEELADLEQFAVHKDGTTMNAPDFNFWGVTFSRDDDNFYATLGTGDSRYLVEGSLRRSRVDVLRENVECPSLSPDETRLAYKKRVGGPAEWRLHVLHLATGRDVALAEKRSIDDQVEWLNDSVVLYGDGHDVWATRADGGGQPERVLPGAASPAARPGPQMERVLVR